MPIPQNMNQPQGGGAVDPRQIIQAIMARMASQRGGGGQPGLTPTGMPQMQAPMGPGGQPQVPPQGGMPGAAGPPQGGPGTSMPYTGPQAAPPVPQGGALPKIMGMVEQHQQKEHNKKAALAENYMLQINSLLASGDPKDQEKASLILSDSKIQKILKTGLEYVPLEEEVPPEAAGVQAAIQKITKNSQPPPPTRKPIIPKPSQMSQEALNLARQKVATSQAEAGKFTAEGEAATIKAEADKQKAEADAIEAKAHAKYYNQQAKESEDKTPSEVEANKAGAILSNARAREANARSKYWDRMPQGKLPGSVLKTNLKAAQDELNIAFREAISNNNKIQDAMMKQSGLSKKTGGWFGISADPSNGSFEASEKVKKFKEAMSYFVGEGSSKVGRGEMTVPQLVDEVTKRVGITIPPVSLPIESDTEGKSSSTDMEIMKLLGAETSGGGL